MEIVKAYPPNIDRIRAKFDLTGKNVVFCYDGKLYNPAGNNISADLMVHEEVHAKQQKEIGNKEWWTKYLEDSSFRLQEEVEAYSTQYKFYSKTASRPQRRFLLKHITEALSGEVYGNIISTEEAKELILK